MEEIMPCEKKETISVRELNADLHVHTIEGSDDAKHELADIVKYYESIGLKYMAVTNHYSEKGFAEESRVISELSEKAKLEIIHGAEVDIDSSGLLLVDMNDGLQSQFTIASIHDDVEVSPEKRMLSALSNPLVDVLGHPGRYIDYMQLNWDEICRFAKLYGKAIEINLHYFPRILSGKKIEGQFTGTIEMLDPDILKIIAKYNVLISIGTDLHKADNVTSGEPIGMFWRNVLEVVNDLSQAGIALDRIINSWDVDRLLEWTRQNRAK